MACARHKARLKTEEHSYSRSSCSIRAGELSCLWARASSWLLTAKPCVVWCCAEGRPSHIMLLGSLSPKARGPASRLLHPKSYSLCLDQSILIIGYRPIKKRPRGALKAHGNLRRPTGNPEALHATVNITGWPRGHGCYVRPVVGPLI